MREAARASHGPRRLEEAQRPLPDLAALVKAQALTQFAEQATCTLSHSHPAARTFDTPSRVSRELKANKHEDHAGKEEPLTSDPLEISDALPEGTLEERHATQALVQHLTSEREEGLASRRHTIAGRWRSSHTTFPRRGLAADSEG